MSRFFRNHDVPQRRLFLKGLATLPLGFSAGALHAAQHDRQLGFRHTHTDERLHLAFRNRHGYIEPALQRMNWLLRDFRTGQSTRMDPRLYDILHALRMACGGETFEIISGYRSPATNSMLRKTGGGGVAKRSLHMDGKAIAHRHRPRTQLGAEVRLSPVQPNSTRPHTTAALTSAISTAALPMSFARLASW